MTEENYEEIANTPEGWIVSLHILAKYMEDGMKEKCFLEAEHDQIYSHVSGEDITEDSEDGKALIELGWFIDSDIDIWAYYT